MSRRPLDHRSVLPCALTFLLLASAPAYAARVRIETPVHHDGQTFISWTSPNGPGWTYRLYTSNQQIKKSSDLTTATLLGFVGDSTWCDRRLSVLTGTTFAFKVDSLALPLAADQGLFVVASPANGNAYYAVTSQAAGSIEERTITVGLNSLASPVAEQLGTPRPVFQRHVATGLPGGADIYTLWTTQVPTLLYPAMSNRASMPFDCGIVRGGSAPQNSMVISMHARGGNLLQTLYPTGHPGEWVLGLDDPIATRDLNTFWYGYHEDYDVTLYMNQPHTTGMVRDYTLRRVVHTLLWARRQFPVDTTRVYAYGTSMGAIGGVLLALRRPDLIAAVMTVAGKFDFSFITDPNPMSGFNPGNVLRDNCDRLWGTVSADLLSSEGYPVYQELNAGTYTSAIQRHAWFPPLIAFNGKNDDVVGWAEKIPFFQAMRGARQGGTFFWDQRDHLNNDHAAWTPMQDTEYLYRFRTDLSFPALSNCSADGDPGDGTAASGDTVGTINGYLEWDGAIVDEPQHWQTTLRLRDLTMRWGPAPAPDSATVDVTPRRLQAFAVVPDSAITWQVTRLEDGAIVQSGTVVADSLGLLTVPGVKVYRAGSRLDFGLPAPPVLAVPPEDRRPARPVIRLSRNPIVGAAALTVTWPTTGPARVELFDAAGRRVRVLFQGGVIARSTTTPLEGGAPAGLYFVMARQGGLQTVQRVALLR